MNLSQNVGGYDIHSITPTRLIPAGTVAVPPRRSSGRAPVLNASFAHALIWRALWAPLLRPIKQHNVNGSDNKLRISRFATSCHKLCASTPKHGYIPLPSSIGTTAGNMQCCFHFLRTSLKQLEIVHHLPIGKACLLAVETQTYKPNQDRNNARERKKP